MRLFAVMAFVHFQKLYLTQQIVSGPVVEDLVEATTREKAVITAMIKSKMDSVSTF